MLEIFGAWLLFSLGSIAVAEWFVIQKLNRLLDEYENQDGDWE